MQMSTYTPKATGRTATKSSNRRNINLALSIFIMLFSFAANAQLTGTKNIPGDYATLSAAITDLNVQGVGVGGVTFNLISGNPETAPAGGYVIGDAGSALLTTASAANPVIIEGNSNVITAFSPQVSGGIVDAVFKIIGADYITIQHFTMQENASNVTNTVASNDKTEFGVALFYVTTTDGAQNNTIRDNVITLSSTYQNAIGIYSASTHSASAPTIAAIANDNTGTNKNTSIYGNTISNVASGILLQAGPVTSTVTEFGTDVGGTSLSTGNNITFGNNTPSDAFWPGSVWALAPTAGSYGIQLRNVVNVNVRYNVLNSASNTQAVAGISVNPSVVPIANIAYTNTISNNNVTLTQNGSVAITGIQQSYGNASATHVCNSNIVYLTQSISAVSTAQVNGIIFQVSALTSTINSNTITIDQSTSSGANSGQVNGIQNLPGSSVFGSSQTISSNIITLKQATTGGTYSGGILFIWANFATNAFTIANANISNNQFLTTGSTIRTTGTTFGIYHDYSYSTGITMNANTINIDKTGTGAVSCTYAGTAGGSSAIGITNNNVTITGTGTAGQIIVFREQDGIGGNSTVKTVTGNTVNVNMPFNVTTAFGFLSDYGGGTLSNNQFTFATAGSIQVTNFQASVATGGGFIVDNNTISLTSSLLTAGLTGISAANPAAGSYTISNNTFTTLNATTAATGSPTITAISISGGILNNIFGNKIQGSSTGAGSGTATITGIVVSGGTTNNIYKNKIYDLSTSNSGVGSLIRGISITGGTSTHNVYNNTIGFTNALSNVNSPDAIRAISITSVVANSLINVAYNTIYMNSSSTGANFGTTGIYHVASATATTAKLELRNNIVVNLSTPGTTGVTSVLRRSVAATLGNYATTSDRNFYYAGVPGATRVILNDNGTVYGTAGSGFAFGPVGTAGSFQALVTAARESNSFTNEGFAYSTPGSFFTSLTGSSSDFLHLQPGIASRVEGGATPVNAPLVTDDYDGDARNSSTPDIGADEFTGTNIYPVIANVTVPTATCTATSHAINADVNVSAGTITSVTLNYNNGAPGSLAMTAAGSTYSATIPAGTPGVLVTWTITAVSSSGTISTFTGTSYKDDPLSGLVIAAVASVNPVCSGSPTSLSASVSSFTTSQIGSGTTNNFTNTNIGAFYGTALGNSRIQILLKASELNAAGIYAGSLTGLKVNVTGGTLTVCKNLTIQMAATALASISGSFATPAFTQLYTIAAYTPVLGVNTHTFTTPFEWDGTSNIIVDYCFSNQATGTTSATNTTSATPFASSVIYGANGTTQACGISTVTASSSIRPNLSFVYAPAVSAITWNDGASDIGSTNPLVVNPVLNITYTASFTALNCPSSANVPVTASALPSMPLANASTQCGTAIPGAFVTTGGGGGGFKWYSAQTAGTLLQTGGGTYTSTISTTTHFWVSESDGNCESPRVEVVATVTLPDAVQASVNNNNVCLNTTIQLSAANIEAVPVNNYTYTWTASPVMGSGVPGGGTSGASISVTPTASGTYTYTATAVDGACTTTSTATVTIKALPVIVSATANPASVCAGGSATLNGTTNIIIPGVVNVGEQSTSLGGVVGNPYRAGNGVGNQVRTQLLITAGELSTLGLLQGNITSVGLVTTAIGGTMINFTIKMGATAATALSTSFLTPTFTTVFTQSSFNAVVGVNTHTFQTPFVWNGTSNIVIDFCQTNSVLGTTTLAAFTPAYLSNIQLAGSTTSCSGTAGTSVAVKPIMQFGGSVNGTGAGTFNWTWNPGSLSGNSVSVTPSGTTTYTVTATDPATTCSNTESVVLTLKPLPSAPSTNNSLQCGTQIPEASVSSNSGAPVPVFVWYTASSGGIAVQSSTSTTLTSSVSATTVFYVAELGDNGCESQRSQVTVTVNPPDPIVANSTLSSLCENSSLNLSVTQALNNNVYDLSWSASPSAGSGLPSPVPGSLGSPLTVTPTVAGTYTYTITGFDVDRGCNTTATVVVAVRPNPSNVTAGASNLNVCTGSTINLTSTAQSNIGHAFTPYTTGFEGTFPPAGWIILNAGTGNQWLSNSAFATPPAAHSGTGAMAYGYNSTQAANTWAITPGQPFIAGDTYTISFWYNTASFGGAYPEKLKVTVATGNTAIALNAGTVLFNNNHLINETYAQATATFTATTTGTYYVGFNCYSDADENVLLIDDISITGPIIEIPTFSWTSVPVGFTSNIQNPLDVVVTQNTVYSVVAHNSFGCMSNPVAVSVTALPLPNAPSGTNSAQCGLAVPTASVTTGGANGTFIWYSAQTGGTLLQTGGSTYLTAINATTHFWVAESNGTCESMRTEVIVTVTQPDPIDALSNVTSICLNGSIQLSAVNLASIPSNSYVYTWTAAAAAGSGIPTSVTGTPVTVTPTIAGTYTYTVTGFDVNGPGSGCTTTDFVTVIVNPVPVDLVAGSSSVSVCGSSTINLTANVVAPATYITEGFTTVVPSGWAQQNLSLPVGTDAAWKQGVSAAGGLFDAHSGAANSYALATYNNLSGAAGTISNWLFTPATTIHNGDVLSFWTRTVDAPAFPDRLEVRMSTNGTSVNVGATNASVGDFTTVLVTVNSTLTTTGYPNTWTQFTATITGLPNTVSGRFAFRYFVTNGGPNGANSDNIGIDDVQFASAPYSFSWSSVPAGFTSAVQNPTGVTVTQNTTYTVTATTIANCSSTSSIVVGYNDRPTGVISGGAQYCAGQNTATQLSIAVTGTGPWSGTLSPGAIPFSGSSSPILVTVSPTVTTTYTIATLNGSLCSSIAADLTGSATVTVNPVAANPTATVVQPTCVLATGTINVTSPLGAGNLYSIVSASGPFQSNPSFVGVAAGTYTIYVQNSFGCFSPATGTSTVDPQPFVPGTPVVTGIVNVCPQIGTATQVTYHATATGNGTTAFNWIIPPTNVTIISGQGTADLTVTFQNGFAAQANKQLRLTATNQCGTSPLSIYYLAAQIPSTPNPISGPTDACPLLGGPAQGTYTINAAPGAASYIWTSQSGTTTISHPNGLGINDTTITVLFAAGFSTSNITVQAVSDCGVSGVRSITVTRVVPSTPSPISGPTNVCENIAPGGTAATYTVPAIPGVTYTWTPPAGSTSLTGQGTNTVSFIFPNGFTTGTVSVSATTGCGTSAQPRTLSVAILRPATPSNIDVIQTSFCGDQTGRVFTYGLASMPANATSIQWTYPAAATLISGQGTTSLKLAYPNTAVSGTVTAQAISNCGSNFARPVDIKLPACPPPTFTGGNSGTNPTAQTKGGVVLSPSAMMEVKIFPNPTVSDFRLEVLSSAKEIINVRVLDANGRLYKTFRVMAYQTIALGAELKAGSYLIEVRQGSQVKTTKVVKF